MIIVDGSNFLTRPYRIPNQKESADLEDWITEQEKELLTDLLGTAFLAELEAQLGSSAPEAIYLQLKNGGTYTYGGKTYTYKGLVSVLIPAIYSRWLDPNTYKLTNVGIVENSPNENSTKLDHEAFRVTAWNEYVKAVGSNGAYWNCYEYKNTLLGFLKAHTEDFPEWDMDSCNLPKFENRYSL